MNTILPLAMVLMALVLTACAASETGMGVSGGNPASPRFAIAIHGGAGTIPRDTPPDQRDAYTAALTAALEHGRERLARGDRALDVVESVVRVFEDDPQFNAGKGAVYTEDGRHELDASIMDGRTLACGAVGAVRTVKNPVSLARLVMERTNHVLLIGDGAEAFADSAGVERVPNSYFDTPKRYEALQKALEARKEAAQPGAAPSSEERPRGTVGCVALDVHGDLAAATSTGGMTAKKYGRVGDTPIIGAGTYADNRTCAVSCTGTGEEFIRHAIAHSVAARMLYAGKSLAQAADEAVNKTLKAGDGGLIAVSNDGDIAMPYNSAGMFRGAADSKGRFEVAIWESPKGAGSPPH